MKTTLNAIRAKSPCASGWRKLLAHLGKTEADDTPVSIVTVLDSNGLDDALWCLRAVTGYDKEKQLYAVWCARQVQHLMTDPRSVAALDVAERFANGDATQEELSQARTDADAYTADADADAADAYTADAAAYAADAAAAYAAAYADAYADADAYAYADAAAYAYADAAYTDADAEKQARAKQETELRRVCAAIDAMEN